jgi:hypothetical protein
MMTQPDITAAIEALLKQRAERAALIPLKMEWDEVAERRLREADGSVRKPTDDEVREEINRRRQQAGEPPRFDTDGHDLAKEKAQATSRPAAATATALDQPLSPSVIATRAELRERTEEIMKNGLDPNEERQIRGMMPGVNLTPGAVAEIAAEMELVTGKGAYPTAPPPRTPTPTAATAADQSLSPKVIATRAELRERTEEIMKNGLDPNEERQIRGMMPGVNLTPGAVAEIAAEMELVTGKGSEKNERATKGAGMILSPEQYAQIMETLPPEPLIPSYKAEKRIPDKPQAEPEHGLHHAVQEVKTPNISHGR